MYSPLGPYPAAQAVYRGQSPIHNLRRFNTPLLLFQGARDLITPPNQTHSIRDALRERGLPVVYREYADEGHGFRRAESIFDAITTELSFYQTIPGLRTEPQGSTR